MKRPLLALAAVAALCAYPTFGAQRSDAGGRGAVPGKAQGGRPLFAANPSAVLATEIAFGRAARETGQWTALARFAAADAVMFVPQAVDARTWLKRRRNPPQSARWQPHRVWISCDGSLAATTGAWQQPDGAAGYFTTVWQRQEKGGGYAWVMNQSDTMAEPPEAPEMIEAKIASCERMPADQIAQLPADDAGPSGSSRDRTLQWSVKVDPQCGRIVTISMWGGAGQGLHDVARWTVDPPAGDDGTPAQSCA